MIQTVRNLDEDPFDDDQVFGESDEQNTSTSINDFTFQALQPDEDHRRNIPGLNDTFDLIRIDNRIRRQQNNDSFNQPHSDSDLSDLTPDFPGPGEDFDLNSNVSDHIEPIDSNNEVEVVNVNYGKKSIIDTCPICQEELDKIEIESCYLECTHWFHFNCIHHWYKKGKKSCPHCLLRSDVIYKITHGED